MEYDLIRGLSELAASEKELASKLKEAAKLAFELLEADQCCIYLWDYRSGRFVLKAAAGDSRGRVKSYGAAEGLPGRVNVKGETVEAHQEATGNEGPEGEVDKGLTGFHSSFAAPLHGDRELRGVILVKYHDNCELTDKRSGLLGLASSGLTVLLGADYTMRVANRAAEELKDLRIRLKNAEKFMALGDMAATLAHEIKSPLVSIGGFAGRVKRKLAKDSPAHKYVDQMIAEVKRLEKVTNGAIRVLKEDLLDLRIDDLNDIVADSLALFEDEFRSSGIEVIRDLSASPLVVMADREQLKIAFDNLIANAIQSMNTGGKLRLSTELFGDWIVAEVEDSGGGIDPRYVNHIFNPFFTTKERGTGLGLPITHSIIMRHKGEIDVVSKRGTGVLFSIRLPRADKKNVC